jgi:hypothetical protein
MNSEALSVPVLKFYRVVFVAFHAMLWWMGRYEIVLERPMTENLPFAVFFIAMGVAIWAFGWRAMVQPGPLAGQHTFLFRNLGATVCTLGGMLLGAFADNPAWVTPVAALGAGLCLLTPVPAAARVDDAAPIVL